MSSKLKIHIRNNHWKDGFLPCDAEGEKNNTITKKKFEKGLNQYPEIKNKIEYLEIKTFAIFPTLMRSSFSSLPGWDEYVIFRDDLVPGVSQEGMRGVAQLKKR